MEVETSPAPLARLFYAYPEVKALTGVDERTLQRWMKRGLFPAQVRLGTGKVARWQVADVDAFLANLQSK